MRHDVLRMTLAALVTVSACESSTSIDRTPPSVILQPALSYSDSGATLEWMAPVDDSGSPAARYEIRYAYGLPFLWSAAAPAPNSPQPGRPGARQTYTFAAPLRGRTLVAAVAATYVSGNMSLPSAPAQLSIPGFSLGVICSHAITATPAAGLDVTISAGQSYTVTTDGTGSAERTDLAGGTVTVSIRSAGGTPFHEILDAFLLQSDAVHNYPMIPVQPLAGPGYPNVLSLFHDAAGGLGSDQKLRKWRTLPVPLYIPPFVNSQGIDYAALASQAAGRWEFRSGVDLFDVVATVPAEGIEMQFLPRAQMLGQIGITQHFNDAQGYPARNVVLVIDEFSDATPLYRVMLHELGHTIRLNHLPAGYIMFSGQPLPADITDVEALAVTLHAALPNGTDLSIYQVTPDTQ